MGIRIRDDAGREGGSDREGFPRRRGDARHIRCDEGRAGIGRRRFEGLQWRLYFPPVRRGRARVVTRNTAEVSRCVSHH